MSEKLRFEDENETADPAAEKPMKKRRKPKNKYKQSGREAPEKGGSESSLPDDTADSGAGKADSGSKDGDSTDGGAADSGHAVVDGETVSPGGADAGGSTVSSAKAAADGKSAESKLKFTKEEKKISKLERKSEKYGKKLNKAREKLPVKKVVKKERVFDEEREKPRTKLTFEKEVIPIGSAKWNQPKKKSLPVKATGAVRTAAVNKLHSKVYEAEHENVGTQAAHRAELLGESAYRGIKKATRSAYRFHKNSPYRRVSKLERLSVKNEMKLSYQKALRDNPKLKSNPVSRFFQKRSIKRQYAAAFRNAKNTAKTTKRAADAAAKVTSAVVNIVRRNPVFLVKMGLLLLIIIAIMGLFTMCTAILSGLSGAAGAVSYAAEDADIDNAELAYTEWEADLQLEIADAETAYGGYDEYRYNVGNIGHDPYELMAFLTAVYGEFTYADVEPALEDIFAEQYRLEYDPETETRYHDTPDGPVPYDYHILNVKLTSKSLSDIIYPLMNGQQRQHFDMLMLSRGGRQYAGNPFDENWLPYITSYYGWRIHPISGEKDYHKGIDVGLPAGTEILAGFDGTVVETGFDAGGFGNYVVVENEDGVQAKYAHCSSISVTNGQTVTKGEVIATVGSTGSSTGPHLHFEVVKDGQYLNPLFFSDSGAAGSGDAPPGSPGGIEIPDYSGEPMGDGSFDALLEEAEKYVGMPYVWGGSSPSTSFDCSGYICWILNRSGAASVGRTTAQGLFNLCTPVSESNAAPGDLLFFHSTYDGVNPVTHCSATRFLRIRDKIFKKKTMRILEIFLT